MIWQKICGDNVELDFLVLNDGENYQLEDKIRALGNKIYKLDVWLKSPFDYFKYNKLLNNFFKDHCDYDVLHINTGSKNFLILKFAKKYGIKKRIVHSHNTGFQSKNCLKILAGNIFKYFNKKYATDFFACSKEAGRWLFGKKLMDENKVCIVNNAIDFNKFKFDNNVGIRIRKELNILDKFVVGNIGRFTNQKNHVFLIDVFYEIYKKNKNSVLLLVGTGEKEQELKDKVKNLGLSEVVFFVGYKSNANEYLSCMDVFVMPSLYEGMPVVGVEAQANGIKCFMSKGSIPEDIKITNCVYFLELQDGAKKWADFIVNADVQRADTFEDFKNNKFLISDMCENLINLYTNENSK